MKKLVLLLLLAAAGLQAQAAEQYPDALYVVGDATSYNWGGNPPSDAPSLYKKSDKVYEGFIYFDYKGGELKFLVTNAYDQGQWGPNTNGSSITTTEVKDVSYVSGNSPDNKYIFNLDIGLYLITADLGKTEITFKKWESSDVYEIGTFAQLKAFADGVNKYDATINAKLTADITEAMSYEIGWYDSDSNNKLYSGEFNGDGHTVTLGIDAYGNNKGLFGAAKGGAYIHDIIVAGSVKAEAKVGGVIGYADGGGTITLTNVINTATIQATGSDYANAAGLVGTAVNNTVIAATNCANMGTVSGQNGQCAAFAGWTQTNGGTGDALVKTTFTNCWNSGTIYNMDNNCNLYRNTDCVTATNCYDATGVSTYTQGTLLANNAVASGELCAKLGFGFRQNLEADSYPNFDVTHGFVVQIGSAKYSTMFNTASDVVIPSGVEAFVGSVNGETLTLSSITNNIAKEEPVVLKGTEGLYNFMPTSGITKASANDLKGSNGSITGGTGIYALASKTGGVGFYPVGSSVTIPEGKAYLEYTASEGEGVKGFTFNFDDDATGIEEMVDGEWSTLGNGLIYNLAGQRISKAQKGINIINGKKVLF